MNFVPKPPLTETFCYLLKSGFGKTTESTEDTATLCVRPSALLRRPRPLWLIFFAIIHNHPEEIKNPPRGGNAQLCGFVDCHEKTINTRAVTISTDDPPCCDRI